MRSKIIKLKSELSHTVNRDQHVTLLNHSDNQAKKIKQLQNQIMTKRKKLVQMNHTKYLYKKMCNKLNLQKIKMKATKGELMCVSDKIGDKANVFASKTDGIIDDNWRICIISLLAIGIAVHRVSETIQTVSMHLFGVKLRPSMLPSSTAILSISDEGHYLAKKFTIEQISDSDHFGIHKDGTSRRKVKIMEQSATLSDGRKFPLDSQE